MGNKPKFVEGIIVILIMAAFAALGTSFVNSMCRIASSMPDQLLLSAAYVPVIGLVWCVLYPVCIVYSVCKGNILSLILGIAISVIEIYACANSVSMATIFIDPTVFMLLVSIFAVTVGLLIKRKTGLVMTVSISTVTVLAVAVIQFIAFSYMHSIELSYASICSGYMGYAEKILRTLFGNSPIVEAVKNMTYMILPSILTIMCALISAGIIYISRFIFEKTKFPLYEAYPKFTALKARKSAFVLTIVGFVIGNISKNYFVSATAINLTYVLTAYIIFCGFSLILNVIFKIRSILVRILTFAIVFEGFSFVLSFVALPLGIIDAFVDFRSKKRR